MSLPGRPTATPYHCNPVPWTLPTPAGRGYSGSNNFKTSGGIFCNDIDYQKIIMDTNFWGPLRVLQSALPLMSKSGEWNR